MDRGIDIILDDPLADQDGIFIVVASPGHEGDHHVPSQRQFSLVRGGAISDDFPLVDLLSLADNRLLVETGILVGPLIFNQVVDVDARIETFFFGGVAFDDDSRGIHAFHNAGPLGRHDRTGVSGHNGFHSRAHQRHLRFHQRYRLPLHVGSHQGAVGVVMFEKRDQRRRHTDQLIGGDIHHVDLRRHDGEEVASLSGGNEAPDKFPVLVQGSVGLGDG
ncbi:MAG: hypothetical protein ACD_87C00064G0001 [uncultured bacterium]|nr:MAG: hypothetical protein ACD_87C00064G0001 [uncultured bacterium]